MPKQVAPAFVKKQVIPKKRNTKTFLKQNPIESEKRRLARIKNIIDSSLDDKKLKYDFPKSPTIG